MKGEILRALKRFARPTLRFLVSFALAAVFIAINIALKSLLGLALEEDTEPVKMLSIISDTVLITCAVGTVFCGGMALLAEAIFSLIEYLRELGNRE